MVKVHIKASEVVHYSQTVDVPMDQVAYLEGLDSLTLIDQLIDRSDVFSSSDPEVQDIHILPGGSHDS